MSAAREAAPAERGLRWRGLTWLALCGPWFFIAYGFCNWFTSRRTDVGTWYWVWEKHVPFVPELVVPYWSLDLLFIGAFFLPRTRSELRPDIDPQTRHLRQPLFQVSCKRWQVSRDSRPG